MSAARIACLAWGSLVWKTGPLRLASAWRTGGPVLPIEFVRVGDGGELATTVLDGAAPVPARWALLDTHDVAAAREMLREREAVDPAHPEHIGDTAPGSGPFPHQREIAAWAHAKHVDVVVWTALPPRFAGVEGRAPGVDEAVAYLRGLQGEVREHAEHYVRHVPREIDTPYRRAFAEQLGWTPQVA